MKYEVLLECFIENAKKHETTFFIPKSWKMLKWKHSLISDFKTPCIIDGKNVLVFTILINERISDE